jgi:hypothetical protein
MKLAVVAHLLAPSGPIPNHPRWPLLVYPQAVAHPAPEEFEALFTRNGWPAAWRNGVFPFHHYHSNAHEALGVYEGEVSVQFGGEGGVEVAARPGDVIVARGHRTQEALVAWRARHRRRLSARREARHLHAAVRAQGGERAAHTSGRLAPRRSGAWSRRAAVRALEIMHPPVS